MEQNTKRIGLTNFLVMLAVAAAGSFLARYANTFAGQAGALFLWLGFLVIAVSYFQMRLEEREKLEEMEFEELRRTTDASLFNTTDAEVFPAKRSREQFERVFVPAFTVLLFLLQCGAAWWVWTWLKGLAALSPIRQPAVTMALFALFALVLFLLGKYSASITRLESAARLVRPGASYLLLGAYICFVVAGAVAAVQMGFPRVDVYAAWALAAVLALAAVETLIALVLEIYRPRVKGRAPRVLYESRVVGLLAQPEGLVTTAAQALDYQFGFRVSETWFYRFLERALAWLILIQLTLLFFSTAFVFISPGEQGLLERFGRPVEGRTVLEPGLHIKFPWPIDRVIRASTREVKSFSIGFVPDGDHERDATVAWDVPHYEEEFNMLVASEEVGFTAADSASLPVDLLSVSIPVQYRISDLDKWAYNYTDAQKILESLAWREVTRFLVNVDLFEVMSSGRAKAANELRQLIQAKADEQQLGVEIVFVGLQDIHPPVKVAKDFQAVIGAAQERQATVFQAEGYRLKTVELARAEATNILNQALAYRVSTVAEAQARATQFANQLMAYRSAPEVYLMRARLEAVKDASTNSRKYIITATNSGEVFNLNLEDKISPDLMDVDLTPPR